MTCDAAVADGHCDGSGGPAGPREGLHVLCLFVGFGPGSLGFSRTLSLGFTRALIVWGMAAAAMMVWIARTRLP